jgi:exosortase
MTDNPRRDSSVMAVAGSGGGPPDPAPGEGAGLSRRDLGLLAFGFAPLLLLFFANLWGRAYYQFFPLALAGAGFLAWARLKEVPRPLSPGPGLATAALLGASFCVLIAATLWWSPWLASLAALLGVVGVGWWQGGARVAQALGPALVLTLTLIPPPLNLDVRLMLFLRGLAVRGSSRLLDAFDVVHYLSGNVIELPRQKLLLEEACSGINSVLLTLAMCLFYLLWRRRSVVRFLLCLPCVLASVLLGNIFRITLGAWLKFHHDIDILSGWRHELPGLLLLALYMALIVSLDESLNFLTSPGPMMADAPAAPTPVSPLPDPMRVAGGVASRWARVAGCAFALLGVAELGRGWLHSHRQQTALVMASKSALRPGATFTLPEQLGNWKRLNAAALTQKVETQGICSKIWHYQSGATVATVALDYPFRGYHDVTGCYRLQGWRIGRQSLQAEGGTNSSLPLMVVEMDKAPASHGLLWFSTVDEQRHWMETTEMKRSFWDRFDLSGGFGLVPTSYRVQVLVAGYGLLAPDDQAAARQLFESARKLLAQQLFEQMQGT